MRKKVAKLLIRNTDYRLKKIPRHAKNDITFLHIGKCAGTQISNVGQQIEEISGLKFIRMSHDVPLKELEYLGKYFFSIRNPLSRFKSGFYSRKRKGAPRLYSEWSDHEAMAFNEFEHANDLAESLFEEGALGRKAFAAMKSIRHTAQNMADWFCLKGGFLDLQPPIWIIRQEYFNEDLRIFLDRAKIGIAIDDIKIDSDYRSAHANDYEGVPPLSYKAKANLECWYIQDLELYKYCEQWMIEQRDKVPA